MMWGWVGLNGRPQDGQTHKRIILPHVILSVSEGSRSPTSEILRCTQDDTITE
jgi:hypothetical protein